MSAGPAGGRLVAVVGPDGVGKTTVARALLEAWDGPTGYVHFRPPLRGTLPPGPPESPPPTADKTPAGSRLGGWARLARSLALFWWGYLAVVRPALRQGALVVADRWGYGYVGQPHALRFRGPDAVGRLAVRLLPTPDLVVNLHAPAAVVRRRKAELTTAQIEQELVRWCSLPLPERRLRAVSSEQPPDRIAQQVLGALRPTRVTRDPA